MLVKALCFVVLVFSFCSISCGEVLSPKPDSANTLPLEVAIKDPVQDKLGANTPPLEIAFKDSAQDKLGTNTPPLEIAFKDPAQGKLGTNTPPLEIAFRDPVQDKLKTKSSSLFWGGVDVKTIFIGLAFIVSVFTFFYNRHRLNLSDQKMDANRAEDKRHRSITDYIFKEVIAPRAFIPAVDFLDRFQKTGVDENNQEEFYREFLACKRRLQLYKTLPGGHAFYCKLSLLFDDVEQVAFMNYLPEADISIANIAGTSIPDSPVDTQKALLNSLIKLIEAVSEFHLELAN